jgi:hypothetical protein
MPGYVEKVRRLSRNLPPGVLYGASAIMGLLAGVKIIGMVQAGLGVPGSEIEFGKQIVYAVAFLAVAGILYKKAATVRAQAILKKNWQRAYKDVSLVMASAGTEDACGKGDYWILDDWN